MKKKKICFVVLGNMYSGAEIVLNRFLKNNYEIDPKFILIYKNINVKKIFEKEYGKSNVFTLDYEYKHKNIMLYPFLERKRIKNKFLNFVKEISPDLLYLNNTTETMLTADMVKNIPVVCHIHDMRSFSKSPIRVFYTVRGIKKCSKALTVSNACKKEWGLDMEVIYNGVDEKKFRYKKINNINNIGFVGSIINRKGVDIIINSLDDIIKKYKNIKFNFVFNDIGDNKILSMLKKKRNEYPENVKLFKNLNEEEMINFYDNIDLLLVPSRKDPLPTVIMEGVARGVLVIGNNVDGIPELLNNMEHNLIDNLNKYSLINKLDEFINMDCQKVNEITYSLYCYINRYFSDRRKREKVNSILYELIYNTNGGNFEDNK